MDDFVIVKSDLKYVDAPKSIFTGHV
jgi:hypothetical protein